MKPTPCARAASAPRSDHGGPYYKDGINNHLVLSDDAAVNPKRAGTKAAAHYHLHIPAGASRAVRLRIRPRHGRNGDGAAGGDRGQALLAADFSSTIAARRREADEFYAAIIPASLSEDDRRITRQASAGMLWSKQFYSYDVDAWLAEHGANHGQSRQRRRARATTKRPAGITWSATTSSRCPTSGNTRGTRRGTSRFTPFRSASSIPTSPSSNSCCCSRNAICTRTGRCRPTNGTSATSIRPCTRGQRISSTSRRSSAPAKATSRSSRASIRSCC